MRNKKNLVLGGAQFGYSYGLKKNKIKKNEAKKIICYAKKFGFSEFDSAISYNIKKDIYKLLVFYDYKISSKLPFFRDIKKKNLEKYIKNIIDNYLKINKIKSLYTLYIHDTKIIKNRETLKIYFNILKKFKEEKKIKKIGITIYSPNEILMIKKNLSPNFPDVIQFPCNFLDRRFCNKKTILLLNKFRTNVYIRSVFLQGLLLMNNENRPKFFLKFKKILLKWDKQCQFSYKQKLFNSINFVKSLNFVNKIILGFDNFDNLIDFTKINLNYKKKKYFKKINNLEKDLVDPRLWKIN